MKNADACRLDESIPAWWHRPAGIVQTADGNLWTRNRGLPGFRHQQRRNENLPLRALKPQRGLEDPAVEFDEWQGVTVSQPTRRVYTLIMSPCYTALFMLTIHIVVDTDGSTSVFDFAGDVPLHEVKPLFEEWLQALEPADLQALTAKIHALTAKAQALQAAEAATHP